MPSAASDTNCGPVSFASFASILIIRCPLLATNWLVWREAYTQAFARPSIIDGPRTGKQTWPFTKVLGHYGPPLTLDQAKKVMAAAEGKVKQHNWNVVISIVDSGGHLVMLERLDGTQLASIRIDNVLQCLRRSAELDCGAGLVIVLREVGRDCAISPCPGPI